MLDFTTKYPVPVDFVPGGRGSYNSGLCAMEVLSIMTEEGNPITGHPYDEISSVAYTIRRLVTFTNDLGIVPPTRIANDLWPVLPKIMDSRQVSGEKGQDFLGNFPVSEYAKALGVTEVDPFYMRRPVGTLARYYEKEVTYNTSSIVAWEYLLLGLKTGISLFWEFKGLTPREDFTEREIGRLQGYLEANKNDHRLNVKELVSA